MGSCAEPREATPGDYWWASLLLRPTDPLLASPLVSSRFFFSSFFFFFVNECQPSCLVPRLPLQTLRSSQLVPEYFTVESQQRQWAAVSQIQGRNRADRHDGETQAPPPWAMALLCSFPVFSPPFPLMPQGRETVVYTQAAQAEADAPPTTIAAQPLSSALWRGCRRPVLVQ